MSEPHTLASASPHSAPARESPTPTPTLTPLPSAVGFIGLGNMGWPMALNLRAALAPSATLYINDALAARADAFVAHAQTLPGAAVVACATARAVADNSDVAFVIVPEGAHVRSVFLGADGLLGGGGGGGARVAGKTFVDCSTIDPATSRAVGAAVAAAPGGGARFYDVPVSGGTAGAAARTLTFMAGAAADDAHFELAVAPLLRALGAHVFCVGGAGLGLAAKLSNNYLSGIIAIATSEAMNLGMRHGIDARVLRACFARSSGANWVNDTTNPVPGVCPDAVTSRGYRGGFKVQLMRKDVALAVESAAAVGARLVLGDAGLAAYTAVAADARCRDLDARVVYRWLGGQE